MELVLLFAHQTEPRFSVVVTLCLFVISQKIPTISSFGKNPFQLKNPLSREESHGDGVKDVLLLGRGIKLALICSFTETHSSYII